MATELLPKLGSLLNGETNENAVGLGISRLQWLAYSLESEYGLAVVVANLCRCFKN